MEKQERFHDNNSISRMIFIISKIMTGLLVSPNSAAEIACGICVNAITQPKILDTPIKKTIIPLILALSIVISQKERNVIFR